MPDEGATNLPADAPETELEGGGVSGLLSVVIFVLAVCGVFSGIGWYVTDLQGGGVSAVGTDVSPENGEKIFWKKGTCYTCHSVGDRGGKRCPNLGDGKDGAAIGERAADRAKERSAQTGRTYTVTDYLVESIANPSAYVVKGFPDHLMPLTYTGQIDLSANEVMSVVAYLQSLGGETDLDAIAKSMSRYGQKIYQKAKLKKVIPRIALPFPAWDPYVLTPKQFAGYKELVDETQRNEYAKKQFTDEQKQLLAAVRKDWLENGKKTFKTKKCWQCHKIAGENFGATEPGNVGPDLTSIGSIQTREYIIESIVNPNAVIVPPLKDHTAKDGKSKMPPFTENLTAGELLYVTYYLSTLKGDKKEPAKDDKKEPAKDDKAKVDAGPGAAGGKAKGN